MSEMLESNLKRSRGELNIVNDTPFMTDILQSELKRRQNRQEKSSPLKGKKHRCQEKQNVSPSRIKKKTHIHRKNTSSSNRFSK